MIKYKRVCKFDQSSLEADGSFAGYASVFGNVDAYRDVVVPGAFSQTLAQWNAKGKLPPVLWQHQSATPIGKHITMAEDGEGLKVTGQLLIKSVSQARETYALVKEGIVQGMSIGYDIFDDGAEYDTSHNVMRLTGIDLWENSIVTFPANDEALISEVKGILARGDLPTIKQFERSLRELGYPKKLAIAIASGGYANLLRSDSGSGASKSSGETLPSVDEVCKAISSFQFTF